MTLYRTIDTSNEIEAIEVTDGDFTPGAYIRHDASSSHWATPEEALAQRRKQLTFVEGKINETLTEVTANIAVVMAAAKDLVEVAAEAGTVTIK